MYFINFVGKVVNLLGYAIWADALTDVKSEIDTVDFGWFVAFESIKIYRNKTNWNCNFEGLLHHPF